MLSILAKLVKSFLTGRSEISRSEDSFRPRIEVLEDREMLSGSPTAADSDRSLTTPTAWYTYNGVSADVLNAAVQQNNLRIIDLKVDNTSDTPTFTATLLTNTGDYGKGWWWYYGLDASQLSNTLAQNNARLIDLDTYTDSSGDQLFAAVMVDNTGAAAKSWWYYSDVSSSDLDNAVTQNNARIIDIDSRVVDGNVLYTAVMVSNTGEDAKNWWYYYNQTPDQISAALQNNQARVISINAEDSNHFDVVMVDQGNDAAWWYYGQTSEQAAAQAGQNGSRIFEESPYTVNGQTEYAVLMLGNSTDTTNSVGNILQAANPAGQVGAYLQEVDGPVLANLQSNQQFEPASMIKVVLLLTVMRKVETGHLNLVQHISMYYQPGDNIHNLTKGNPDVDPTTYPHTPSNALTQTLQKALERMMQVSDNRATMAIQQLVSRRAINATAKWVGMNSTVFASTLGTGIPGNYLTLQDAALLYEKVADGTLLGTGIYRTEFWRCMTNNDYSYTPDIPFGKGVFGGLVNVIQQEAAAKLGLAFDDPAVVNLTNAFVSQINSVWKGGGYDLWFGIDSGHARIDRTVGGWIELPFKAADGTITHQGYVYGIYIDNAVVPRTSTSDAGPELDQVNQAWSDAQGELLRDQIRAALATW
jgi:hypothetical protein